MSKIGIIIGSTRPARFTPRVAKWFFDRAQNSGKAQFELVDIVDYNLPMLDEPKPSGNSKEHTRVWQSKIAEFDGYIFVTPEYNHAPPASLKNAIDFINNEMSNKPLGYVAFGSIGGARAIEQLRPIAAQFNQFDLRPTVMIIDPKSHWDEHDNFTPTERHNQSADKLIGEIAFWSDEFIPIRTKLHK